MNELLEQSRAPLMINTISKVDFFKVFGHHVTYNTLERCLVETSSNKRPSMKNLEDLLFFFLSKRFVGYRRC